MAASLVPGNLIGPFAVVLPPLAFDNNGNGQVVQLGRVLWPQDASGVTQCRQLLIGDVHDLRVTVRSHQVIEQLAAFVLAVDHLQLDAADRAAHLRELSRRTGAKAVLFWEASFCEPEQFVLPQLRAALSEVGLASAIIEVDPGEPMPQQAITRLEALLEVVS